VVDLKKIETTALGYGRIMGSYNCDLVIWWFGTLKHRVLI